MGRHGNEQKRSGGGGGGGGLQSGWDYRESQSAVHIPILDC